MKKILYFPFLFVWLTLSAAGAYAIYVLFSKIYLQHYEVYRFLYFGFGAYAVTIFIIKPRIYNFWNILVHELVHSIFAVLTFSKPRQLFVSSESAYTQGGYMTYYCKPGIMGIVRSHMISLAPYFFPLFAVVLGGLYLLVKPDSPGYISGSFFDTTKCKFLLFLIGFAYSYHIIIFLRDARPSQSDFDSMGFLYGLTFVVFVQTAFLVMILLLLTQDYEGHKILLEDVEILRQQTNNIIDIDYLRQQINNLLDINSSRDQIYFQHVNY